MTRVMMWCSSPVPTIRSSPGGPKYVVANLLGLISGLVSASSDACCCAALSFSCLDKNRGGSGGGGYSGASGRGGYVCSWVGIASPSCLHSSLILSAASSSALALAMVSASADGSPGNMC